MVKGIVRLHRQAVFLVVLALATTASKAAPDGDSLTIHRLEVEAVDGAVLHTNRFLAGYNPEVRTMNQYFTAKLKYAFMPSPDSEQAQIYKGAYQGAGLAYHHLNPQIGNPLSLYLFQGATIASLSHKVSLNYEWDFGVAYGWKSYASGKRPDNRVIGSKMTAYMDADVYLRWMLSPQLDLNVGLSASHFSNGNTSIPNAGLNVAALKLSLAYYLNRPVETPVSEPLPPFLRHWSTDIVLFGGWKKRGSETETGVFVLPKTYGVVGVNINPMYNINHWFNAGASLDMYYDHSANLSMAVASLTTTSEKEGEQAPQDATIPEGDDLVGYPAWHKQVTAGLSLRGEFVMPYFTINFGIGHNFLNTSSSIFGGYYELLALKIALSRQMFLHVGYSLYDFQYPNNLMLGIGYRIGGRRKY